MAVERGFMELVQKPESYEICFIPDNDYRGFLKRRVPALQTEVAGGEFVLEDGTVVGKHEGYPFYTIGQRKGLGIALGFPAYVTKIEKDKNRVVLGNYDDLAKNAMRVGKLTLSKYPELIDKPTASVTKVRYNDSGTEAVIEQVGDKMEVRFERGVHAIAPGQAAVFYEGNDVIGGGWIEASYNV
ncbi:MAG: tRNA 2-thiouridine(34) synthase MnmA, partial [Bacteroidota bacterium]|nr:tRNA 2-thiouridine(34) synthase MnmA [Bacteroidota bacterium]